jgi:hypothetical protein
MEYDEGEWKKTPFPVQPSVGSLAHTVMFELKYYIEQAEMTGKEPGRGAST